jgi:NADPH:quinone reductase-like Zn-dependent oxidoreductase
MHAAVLRSVGTSPRYEPFPEPVAVDGEAVVRVRAASLKPIDKGDSGFQVVIDYVWGPPTETFLAAIRRQEFAQIASETRLVQVGASAGPTIALPAALLRSTAVTILGTAGIPPRNILTDALRQVMAQAAAGKLHVDTERVPLADIENAWQRDRQGPRLVIIP